MSRNKSKNKVISDDDNSYMENKNYTELSDIEKPSSIYSNDTDTEENFEVQHQEDLSKIHALEKQLEQMRCSMNSKKNNSRTQNNISSKAKNQVKPTSQNNVKLANKSSTKLTIQSNMKLTTQNRPKAIPSQLLKDNQMILNIDWSSSDPEQDALRNCAERKILKNCDNITYRYTDPKLIESVIEKVSKRTENRLKVSTNIQKRIRVSPNEDVLDTNNNEQILNNNIFNVDQDEQESREEGEQENQDEQEQESLDKQEKVNQDEHEQANQDEHEQANQDEHEQENQDEVNQ
ncbi:hypothetical protein C2G38_2150691 [Gigaspora rosea]|uniref:Uncharacterized protein n=1 Tax=Gigaspora rosea TaxID=44941 RepID=A0A397TTY4_9GLOM|nr:hypothetical protein C2G38_2150691 [Gigaspora rosea]